MAEIDPSVQLGQALAGQYTIERELGRGGMGIVYLAHDVRLDRRVAIKLFPPSLMGNPVLRARFVREARTSAQLSHPHIVPVYRADEVDNFVFFVMGYVEGESLADRLARLGILSPAETVRVLREAAWALAYGHARGVVHRDVKPENLMLEKGTGRVVITDFGIARDGRAEPLTRDGSVMGSVHYMSPEQVAGEPIDGRTDLYALGVVGFKCLSGRLPFEAEQASAVIVQHVTKPPPSVADVARDIPEALARVIDSCLAKDPADRPASGEALADLLTAALDSAAGPTAVGNQPVSEAEARAIWQRAAELQAEAATRIHTRYRREAPDPAATPAGGYRFRDVEQAAVEAGIGAEFVALAAAERHDQVSVVAAQTSDREERVWTRFLGTDQRSISVSGEVPGSPREVLELIGQVFPEHPYQLQLRDTIGGHPLDGGVMVFDVSKFTAAQGGWGPGGMSMFLYRMAAIVLTQLNVTLKSSSQGRTEVRCYGDLRPGLRKNWQYDKGIASVAGVLGAGSGLSIGLAALGLSALAAAPAVLGAAALGGGALRWYRWLYRRAVRQAEGEISGMIAKLGSERRARQVFGGKPSNALGSGRDSSPPARG